MRGSAPPTSRLSSSLTRSAVPAARKFIRKDIDGNSHDKLLVAMHRVASPFGEARDDYAIFSELARRLGAEQAFTEGRSVRQWLAHLYERTRLGLVEQGLPAPGFEEFWQAGSMELPQLADAGGNLRRFRDDPVGNRRLVRPGGPRRRDGALRARQSQRADRRRRHLRPRPGLHRPAHDRPGRTLHRQPAADPGLRSAAGLIYRSRNARRMATLAGASSCGRWPTPGSGASVAWGNARR